MVREIKYSTGKHLLSKAYKGDSGFDVKANIPKNLILKAGDIKKIPTGIRLDLPEGIDGQIRSRSGLAANHGIAVLNSPGTIDSGYKGEVQIILINHGKQDYEIKDGDKIAQIVFSKIISIEMTKVELIDMNSRFQIDLKSSILNH